MATVYVDVTAEAEIDLTPGEFVDSCSDRELKELESILGVENHMTPETYTEEEMKSLFVSAWDSKIHFTPQHANELRQFLKERNLL